eukprot:363897-Chlamydomonas_euryale.AAC.10
MHAVRLGAPHRAARAIQQRRQARTVRLQLRHQQHANRGGPQRCQADRRAVVRRQRLARVQQRAQQRLGDARRDVVEGVGEARAHRLDHGGRGVAHRPVVVAACACGVQEGRQGADGSVGMCEGAPASARRCRRLCRAGGSTRGRRVWTCFGGTRRCGGVDGERDRPASSVRARCCMVPRLAVKHDKPPVGAAPTRHIQQQQPHLPFSSHKTMLAKLTRRRLANVRTRQRTPTCTSPTQPHVRPQTHPGSLPRGMSAPAAAAGARSARA